MSKSSWGTPGHAALSRESRPWVFGDLPLEIISGPRAALVKLNVERWVRSFHPLHCSGPKKWEAEALVKVAHCPHTWGLSNPQLWHPRFQQPHDSIIQPTSPKPVPGTLPLRLLGGLQGEASFTIKTSHPVFYAQVYKCCSESIDYLQENIARLPKAETPGIGQHTPECPSLICSELRKKTAHPP